MVKPQSPQITIQQVTSPSELEKCYEIREKVFIQEQKTTQDEEMDGLDDQAEHFLLYVDGNHAVTSRLRYLNMTIENSETPQKTAKIERVACLKTYRGLTLGMRIMTFLMDHIKEQNDAELIVLAAQCSVIGFYEKLGFTAYGDIFLDARIDHRWMKYDITNLK